MQTISQNACRDAESGIREPVKPSATFAKSVPYPVKMGRRTPNLESRRPVWWNDPLYPYSYSFCFYYLGWVASNQAVNLRIFLIGLRLKHVRLQPFGRFRAPAVDMCSPEMRDRV